MEVSGPRPAPQDGPLPPMDEARLSCLQEVVVSSVVAALLPRLEAIESSIERLAVRLTSQLGDDLDARISAAVAKGLSAGSLRGPQDASAAPAPTTVRPAPPAEGPGPLARAGPFSYCANRGKRSFDPVFRDLAAAHPNYAGGALFTYFDTYGGKQLPDVGAWPRQVRLIERSVTNDFDNKRIFAKQLQDTGCEEAFAKTYFSADEALAATEGCDDAIFFVKSAHGTAGKDMRVLSREGLREATVEDGRVIQRGIQDLALVDGRKFVVRFFVLIHDGALLAHRRAIAIVHGPPYDRRSTDYDVQICHDTSKAGSAVRCHTLASLPEGDAWHRSIARRVLEIFPALLPLLEQSSPDRYSIVGLDALIDSAGEARLIEANMYPNLWDLMEDINVQVKQAMLRDVLARVLLGESPPELQPVDVAAAAA